MRNPGLIKIVLSVLFISSVSLYAAPVIKDFSSKGGRTTNKTVPKDIMYLARPGDKITFTVKADGADKYVWQVNKVSDKQAKGNSFVWTVPSEKGIWEINLNAVGGKEETHREWVVSTLSKQEAPDIFDYFSDGKYYGRSATDPWGRKLPEWGETNSGDYIQKTPKDIYDAKDGFLQKKPKVKGSLFLPSSTVYGTWRIKYKGSLGYYFTGTKDRSGRIQSRPGTYTYSHAGTGFYGGHFWFKGRTSPGLFKGGFQKNIKYTAYGYPRRQSFAWRRGIAEYGSYLSHVPGWVDAKIIHAPDGAFYIWVNGRLMPGTFNFDNLVKVSEFIRFASLTVDNVEVYKDRYIFPPKSAAFEDYQSVKVKKREVIRKGIVINGRGVRLSEVVAMVGDKSLFSYDQTKKTAVCRTDLVLNGAAELILKGETLKMHSETPGRRHIRIFEAATLKLENSTITSTNGNHYQWRFTSPYNTEYVPAGGAGAGYFDSRAILIARNSTIDNCGFLYLQSPRGLVLENTKLTNLVEIKSGPSVASNPRFHPVSAAFRFRETMPTVPYRGFRNLVFTGKKGGEAASVVFDGGDTFGKLNVYDSVFENVTVKALSHSKTIGTGRKDDWQSKTGQTCWAISETSRTLNLINCKFEKLDPANKFCWIQPKYYLDLKVVDKNGKPVSGAKVTITNEIDDENHPSENLKEEPVWTCTYGEGYGYHLVPYQKWADVNDMRSTITGSNGHTPLPNDKDKSLVLTDYTKMNEKNFDGINIVWSTSNNRLYLRMDVYDDEKGHILAHARRFSGDAWKQGQTHHAKLTYDKKEGVVHLVITQGSKTVWDTGKLPLFTPDRSRIIKTRLDFNSIELGIGRSGLPRPGEGSFVKWDPKGYISLYHSGVSSGGKLATRIDNMRLNVEGLGVIENNDYSRRPSLTFIPGKVYYHSGKLPKANVSYPLTKGTGGNSLSWEFDIALDRIKARCCARSAVWLRKRTDQSHREYTYRITVEAGGEKKVITGVNPGPKWHRPDPNQPTYTITAVLDGKTVTEDQLKK